MKRMKDLYNQDSQVIDVWVKGLVIQANYYIVPMISTDEEVIKILYNFTQKTLGEKPKANQPKIL